MGWRVLVLLIWWGLAMPAQASDLCQAGPKDAWQSKTELEHKLLAQGWRLRRIKVEDGCYEAYGWDASGKPVEAYFHPRTLAPVSR
jgi:hypothetical protein